MIYGKMWLVVKPSVGIPVFLGAVAVSSFAVHYALLTHTTWVPQYLNGSAAKATASIEVSPKTATAAKPADAMLAAQPQQRL
jgi:light-harvesting protein B-800-850 alpha chain